jgi:glycosidase
VFYEAFVRSFYDTNDDGVGDLQGLTSKLSYLSDLGINAIWLMPVCSSPSYHGYDVTNYKNIQPAYGTKQDYINFVDSAHSRGIKVIFDFVMNHSSSAHPWFLQSKINDPFYRDFYRWSSTDPGTIGPWGQQVWHEYFPTQDYYYGLFWEGMPDLNYEYTPVKDSMFSIAQFWLDSMHADGFRLDAAPYIFEEGSVLMNAPQTIQFWKDFRTYYKSVNDSAMAVGEVWETTDSILPYMSGDGLDFCFEFDLASQILFSVNYGTTSFLNEEIQYDYDQYPFLQFGTFLTNHDQNRVMDVFSINASKMKAAAAIYLTLPGIPFVYYGEEIGMSGSGPDENKRRPMQWTSGVNAGFTTGNPWEALNSNYSTYNVEVEQADSNSVLNWYKKLIAIRHQEVALRRGVYIPTSDNPSSICAFLRAYGSDTNLVVVNTSNQFFTDFTVNLGGSGLIPGDKFLTDLLNANGSFTATLDAAYNFGTLEIGPYGVLIYKISSFSGIADAGNNESWKVYPNPAIDQVTIETKTIGNSQFRISIFDATGKLLQTEEAKAVDGKLNVNVSYLDGGIYFLKLESDEKTLHYKISVLR